MEVGMFCVHPFGNRKSHNKISQIESHGDGKKENRTQINQLESLVMG